MKRALLAAACVLAMALAGCASAPPAPHYAFAADLPVGTPPPDFAELEHAHPLSLEERARLTPESLRGLDQESIDGIYARLTAGAFPDGAYDGQVLVTTGTRGNWEVDELTLGYLRKLLPVGRESLNETAAALWRGKVFERSADGDRILRNRLASLDSLWSLTFLAKAAKPAQAGGSEYRLFPAKVYCGQSLLDSRRESIVIDYLFTDEVPGYREVPDFLAGRRGLQVRDEIRMVRPGLYIGRAYVNRIFFLTFSLHNAQVDTSRSREQLIRGDTPPGDCWDGTQGLPTQARR